MFAVTPIDNAAEKLSKLEQDEAWPILPYESGPRSVSEQNFHCTRFEVTALKCWTRSETPFFFTIAASGKPFYFLQLPRMKRKPSSVELIPNLWPCASSNINFFGKSLREDNDNWVKHWCSREKSIAGITDILTKHWHNSESHTTLTDDCNTTTDNRQQQKQRRTTTDKQQQTTTTDQQQQTTTNEDTQTDTQTHKPQEQIIHHEMFCHLWLIDNKSMTKTNNVWTTYLKTN